MWDFFRELLRTVTRSNFWVYLRVLVFVVALALVAAFVFGVVVTLMALMG